MIDQKMRNQILHMIQSIIMRMYASHTTPADLTAQFGELSYRNETIDIRMGPKDRALKAFFEGVSYLVRDTDWRDLMSYVTASAREATSYSETNKIYFVTPSQIGKSIPRTTPPLGLFDPTAMRKSFREQFDEMLKKKHLRSGIIRDLAFVSEDKYSNLRMERTDLYFEQMALFALAFELSAEDAKKFIFDCDKVRFNTSTFSVVYAVLLYYLEHYHYDTWEFVEDCMRCIEELSNANIDDLSWGDAYLPNL